MREMCGTTVLLERRCGMRGILFKAKTESGIWVEGDLLHYESGEVAILERPFSKYGYEAVEISRRTKVVPSTICQYTGLIDKNGNKIWENDVVKYHFGNDVAHIRFGEYQSCFDSTKTGHIGFYVDWDCKKALRKDLGYWVNMIDCNVIGNILDNPDLLKGGAE